MLLEHAVDRRIDCRFRRLRREVVRRTVCPSAQLQGEISAIARRVTRFRRKPAARLPPLSGVLKTSVTTPAVRGVDWGEYHEGEFRCWPCCSTGRRGSSKGDADLGLDRYLCPARRWSAGRTRSDRDPVLAFVGALGRAARISSQGLATQNVPNKNSTGKQIVAKLS